MVYGYHVVMPMYGFWLPNDPRGSWSDFVRRWELARFGKAAASQSRRELTELSEHERQKRDQSRKHLRFPPVSLTGQQAAAVGRSFGGLVRKNNYSIWACAILPEHTHLVLARHSYAVEQMINLLKGAATSALIRECLHPLAGFARNGQRPPRMWSAQEWKVFLDSEEAIESAIAYVNENPLKEGKPVQVWPFAMPFAGIDRSGWTTWHG